MQQQPSEQQRRIAAELGVDPHIDVAVEVERRVDFLTELMASSGATALIVGISGGVDSAVAGALCTLAVTQVPGGRFVAVRLPYGLQHDDADAQLVLDALAPDLTVNVDMKPASDAALDALLAAGVTFPSPERQDFTLGNIKARQRMVAQYAIGSLLEGLVIGTDHAAEAVTGFFTKYGDGGVDATPLSGLTKRQVRALATHLGVPTRIVTKTPTADLESLRPQLSDEQALGLSYDEIDDFLEGKPVTKHVHETLLAIYARTEHKRRPPAAPAPLPAEVQ